MEHIRLNGFRMPNYCVCHTHPFEPFLTFGWLPGSFLQYGCSCVFFLFSSPTPFFFFKCITFLTILKAQRSQMHFCKFLIRAKEFVKVLISLSLGVSWYFIGVLQVHDLKVPVWSHFCWKLQPGERWLCFQVLCLCQITLTLGVDEDTSIVWFWSLKGWKGKEILPRSEHRRGLFSIIIRSCRKLQNHTYSPKECHDTEAAVLKTVVSAKRSGD